MKNEFDENKRYQNWPEIVPRAQKLCWESVINSLNIQGISLMKKPSIWEEENTTNSFVLPEIVKKYTFKGLENLSLGNGDINFFTRLKTVWDSSPYASYQDKRNAVYYQLLKGVPKDQIETFGYNFEHLLEGDFKKYMAEEELTVEMVMEASPRQLRWHGESYKDPYVFSINMACAFGFESIPEGLANFIQTERHKIAEKYDLFLGRSSAVPAQCMGFGVNVDAFTLIPKDISKIDMTCLVNAVTDIGELIREYTR